MPSLLHVMAIYTCIHTLPLNIEGQRFLEVFRCPYFILEYLMVTLVRLRIEQNIFRSQAKNESHDLLYACQNLPIRLVSAD